MHLTERKREREILGLLLFLLARGGREGRKFFLLVASDLLT